MIAPDRKSFSDGVQFAFDSTSLTLAMECPRKYHYRMLRNLVPQTTSVHLLFGGIYAAALEYFYGLRAVGADLEEAILLTVKKAMIDSWDKETNQPLAFNDAKKTRVTLIRTIIWYLDAYGDEDEAAIKTHHLANGKAAVELSFALELTDDIIYCGHLDRVVEFSGGLYWMDQKTTGQTLGPYFFDGFKMSNQFMGYTWAGQIMFQAPVRGGIIDAAQIASGFSRFERGFASYTREQIEEWTKNVEYHVKSIQSLTLLDKFPMNLTACGNYGGCPYKSICSSHPSVREHVIQSNFVHPAAVWDPLVPR